MITKLLIGSLIIVGVKTLIFWITLMIKTLIPKTLKPKVASIEERQKISKKFTAMMRSRKLKRKEILELKDYIYKITKEPNRGYTNECHYICHCIKHCDITLKDLFQINMILGGK